MIKILVTYIYKSLIQVAVFIFASNFQKTLKNCRHPISDLQKKLFDKCLS